MYLNAKPLLSKPNHLHTCEDDWSVAIQSKTVDSEDGVVCVWFPAAVCLLIFNLRQLHWLSLWWCVNYTALKEEGRKVKQSIYRIHFMSSYHWTDAPTLQGQKYETSHHMMWILIIMVFVCSETGGVVLCGPFLPLPDIPRSGQGVAGWNWKQFWRVLLSGVPHGLKSSEPLVWWVIATSLYSSSYCCRVLQCKFKQQVAPAPKGAKSNTIYCFSTGYSGSLTQAFSHRSAWTKSGAEAV